MKALGVLLIWLGYSFFVYGVDKARGNCTSYKTIAWPSSSAGDLTQTCSGSSSSSSSSSTGSSASTSTGTAGQIGVGGAAVGASLGATQGKPNKQGGIGQAGYGPFPVPHA